MLGHSGIPAYKGRGSLHRAVLCLQKDRNEQRPWQTSAVLANDHRLQPASRASKGSRRRRTGKVCSRICIMLGIMLRNAAPAHKWQCCVRWGERRSRVMGRRAHVASIRLLSACRRVAAVPRTGCIRSRCRSRHHHHLQRGSWPGGIWGRLSAGSVLSLQWRVRSVWHVRPLRACYSTGPPPPPAVGRRPAAAAAGRHWCRLPGRAVLAGPPGPGGQGFCVDSVQHTLSDELGLFVAHSAAGSMNESRPPLLGGGAGAWSLTLPLSRSPLPSLALPCFKRMRKTVPRQTHPAARAG